MSNNIDIDVDVDDAKAVMDGLGAATEEGAEAAIRQLLILAEGPLKAEAPEGAGRQPHMRDSVTTEWYDDLAARIYPDKEASDGELLAGYVVGNPLPDYSPSNPPPVGPLIEWADAKTGQPGIGWYLQKQIAERGHQASFPNPFVDRAIDQWESQVDSVAGKHIRQAIQGAMR